MRHQDKMAAHLVRLISESYQEDDTHTARKMADTQIQAIYWASCDVFGDNWLDSVDIDENTKQFILDLTF